MKISSLIHYCLLYLFTSIGLLQAEGFISGTLVKTDSDYTTIERLKIGDQIISFNHNHTIEECSIIKATTYIIIKQITEMTPL